MITIFESLRFSWIHQTLILWLVLFKSILAAGCLEMWHRLTGSVTILVNMVIVNTAVLELIVSLVSHEMTHHLVVMIMVHLLGVIHLWWLFRRSLRLLARCAVALTWAVFVATSSLRVGSTWSDLVSRLVLLWHWELARVQHWWWWNHLLWHTISKLLHGRNPKLLAPSKLTMF